MSIKLPCLYFLNRTISYPLRHEAKGKEYSNIIIIIIIIIILVAFTAHLRVLAS
jgi:hypothetical protein